MNKLIAFALVCVMAFASHGSYLYWRVGSSDYDPSVLKDEANMARLAVVDEEGTVTYLDAVSISEAPTSVGYTSLDNLSDPSAYSYYIELINYDASAGTVKIVGHSMDVTSYSAMVQAKYIDAGELTITPAAVWHGGPYIIPEPTTGLLVTVGMGLLALRRRRKIGIAG